MALKVIQTQDPTDRPPLVMMVFGAGGVGKTTFATTAPKPLIVDCEGGTKYLGLRGITADVVRVSSWAEMAELPALAKGYDTIVIDPIGELMEKLKRHMIAMRDSKLVQKDGSPTMAGWGWLKDTMRSYLKVLRDSGKHVIIIAHVTEDKDEDKIVKRPMIATKLSDEIINMVDIVGYMVRLGGTEEDPESGKRVIMVEADSEKYVAKDRTGQLGRFIPPDFKQIIEAVSGGTTYAWSSPKAQEAPKQAPAQPEVPAQQPAPENVPEETTEVVEPQSAEIPPTPEPAKVEEVKKEMSHAGTLMKEAMNKKIAEAKKAQPVEEVMNEETEDEIKAALGVE